MEDCPLLYSEKAIFCESNTNGLEHVKRATLINCRPDLIANQVNLAATKGEGASHHSRHTP